MNKKVNMSKYRFKMDSMAISGATLLGSQLAGYIGFSISPLNIALISGGSLIGGILLDRLYDDGEYEKLFRMCGIVNKDDQVPLIIKKTKKDNKSTLVLHLPAGLSQKQFEEKQLELEQNLNSKIMFGFNKNLIMDLIEMNLKTEYPYKFRQCERASEVFCGIGYDGDFSIDIEKDQHIIVAGESDSGKSSFITAVVLSYILSDKDIDLHLIDFQGVTLGVFEDCKKVKSYGEKPEDFSKLMDELEAESNRRLKLFRSVKNRVYVEKLETWNKEFPDKALPYKFVVVDEFSILAQHEDLLEKFRQRVSMDRKTGIHYMIALQRPDAKIIEGAIKATMSTRLAFKAVSPIDSEVILGGLRGAEKIKIQGRFLARHRGELKEIQSLYIKPKDIRKLLKQHSAYKTKYDLELEKKERMKALRDKCINPYLKGKQGDPSENQA